MKFSKVAFVYFTCTFHMIAYASKCHSSINSVLGIFLMDHVMDSLTADSPLSCHRKCTEKPGCRSINYYISKSLCELNSRTIESTKRKPGKNQDAVYFKNPNPLVLKNCAELLKAGFKKSGVYTIDPDGKGEFKVYCDQKTAGGGWTVFQKRQDGSVDFYRGWNEYKNGFGNIKGEFWLGLDKIYRLTIQSHNRLRVDLEDTKGKTAYAEYDMFAVTSERNKYSLSLGAYSGTAGDSLSNHHGMPFTTKDRDNDRDISNCAVQYKGAWWYNACHY